MGGSGNGESLVRPALPGRKTHRSWVHEEIRGRRQMGSQTGGRPEAREANTDSGSSSNSELQLSNMADLGEGSQRRSSRYNNGRWSHGTEGNVQSPHARSVTPRTQMSESQIVSSSSPEEQDPFWAEVRTGEANARSSQVRTEVQVRTSSELGEEEEEEEVEDGGEEGSGVMEVQGQTVNPELLLPAVSVGERRMSRREKNRMRCLRRRQRKKERWRQLQESQQSSTADPSSSSSSSSEDDEDLNGGEREGYICAVCLDVYFCPYMCHPCNHIFCEPCLRTLAKNSPTNTPCPLCRTVITHVFFQKELNQTARTFFPKEYLSRKQNFQKATCAKWPLPSCRKLFRIFGGFQRQSSPIPRRRFPHTGGFHVDALDFEDQSRGWHLDMDMVIIYIYSANWIIGFFIFCFICYLFFPSL